MDSRIEPLGMLGLSPGDAKVLRNAGARVTDDVLRGLVLATNLLNVDRVCIIQHTDCAMTKASEEQLRQRIGNERGADASGWLFHVVDDQRRVLAEDAARIRTCPLIPPGTEVGTFVYDVDTGELLVIDEHDDPDA
jgi:carbonic anhydrase